MKSFSSWIVPALVVGSLSLTVYSVGIAGEVPDPDPDYDRLDGRGKSGKKVDVVEWEGNLEIHVYPAGSLRGLGLKLDKKNKDKPVMVISYRFGDDPNDVLIRRAILGVKMNEGFQAYRDPTADGYDKIIVSNNGLASPLALYRLDPSPKQLYPDGHPALAQGEGQGEVREPASREAKKPNVRKKEYFDEDSGTIKPFFSPDKANFERGY